MREDRVPTLDAESIKSLSQREDQVLQMASSGLLDKEIGAELGLSLNTLRTYWSRIRSKVGEGSRTALVAAYVEQLSAAESHIDFDWEVDFDRWTYRRLSDRPLHLSFDITGEVSFEDILALIHDEDRPRVRELVKRAMSGELHEFHYAARLVLPAGQAVGSAFIRVVFDDAGRAIKMLGRRVNSFDVRAK